MISNLRLNGVSSSLAKWGAVSTSKDSSIEMHLRLDPSSLTTAGAISKRDHSFSVFVPSINVEDLINNLKGTLLAKIDIEGAEMPLINQLFVKYRKATLVIILEILTEFNYKEVVKIATANDFILYPIDEKSKRLGNLFSFNTAGINRNYLVVSNKARSIINAIGK